MAAQHVSIHKQGPLIYIKCTIDGHNVTIFDKNMRNAVLSGRDISITQTDFALQGQYIRKGV